MGIEIDNSGGPAFPCEHYDEMGMTLRDWFAGQALMGLLARKGAESVTAEDAYALADAMLAERNRRR